jgi:hypothetical protein
MTEPSSRDDQLRNVGMRARLYLAALEKALSYSAPSQSEIDATNKALDNVNVQIADTRQACTAGTAFMWTGLLLITAALASPQLLAMAGLVLTTATPGITGGLSMLAASSAVTAFGWRTRRNRSRELTELTTKRTGIQKEQRDQLEQAGRSSSREAEITRDDASRTRDEFRAAFDKANRNGALDYVLAGTRGFTSQEDSSYVADLSLARAVSKSPAFNFVPESGSGPDFIPT